MADEKKFLTIIRTGDKKFTVNVLQKKDCGTSCGRPFDLTGATEITACLPKEGGGAVLATLTGGKVNILSAVLGEIEINLDETDTAQLNLGEEQDFEIQIEIGSEKTIVQILECLNVLDTIC